MQINKVVSIGEALIDRLGPVGGDPAVDQPATDCFGGAPANVACALSRLGAKVSFVGSLGNDFHGRNFKNLFRERGVNTIGLQQDKSRPTRVVLVRRNEEGERFFESFKGDNGSGFADQAISKNLLIKNWPFVADNAKWLITGSIPLASPISSEAYLCCIKKALDCGMMIAMDLNWRPTFWYGGSTQQIRPSLKEINNIKCVLRDVALIKLAKEEAEWFFNSSDPNEISSVFSHNPSVIVTDGSRPISWLINSHRGISNAIKPTSIVDTTGAGDAFMAGLIYKLLDLDLEQVTYKIAEDVIQFANGCGAFVCQGLGAIDSQPYLVDVESILSLYKGGMS